MRKLLLFHFFLVSIFLNEVAYAAERQLGILVQVKKKEALNIKEFKDLISKNNLTPDKYYSTLKIQSFKFKKEQGIDLKSICQTIQKRFSDVLSCEINFKITPQSASSANTSSTNEPNDCESPSPLNKEFEKTISETLSFSESKDCDLFHKKNPKFNIPDFDPGLSPLWAQEYIGADLLKEEMVKRKIDTSNASSLLAVWDSSEGLHGEKVANLIAGPFASSLIAQPKTKDFVNLESTEDYIGSFEKEFVQCKGSSNCPRFINNSMRWLESDLIKKSIGKLSGEKKVVFVTSAGNDTIEVENAKRESSRAGESIVVASHAPNGRSSSFTSFAPEVDITAPSDYHILTYDNSGILSKFGGTSGAAPLVTSTLLSFELIAGVKLSTPQFKILLKKTAIRHQNDPPRKVTGAGYLNSYKIGAIALKLVNLCKAFKEKVKKDECMLKSLESEDLYDFSRNIKEDKIMSDIQSAFPQCGEESTSQNQTVSCDKKKMAINELRKAAFLMPENLNLWKKLSCVHSVEGLTANAEYYSALARGKRFIENELASIPLGVNADFVEIMASSEFSKDYEKFALAAVKQNGQALKYASEALRNNREAVLSAFKVNEGALVYASLALKNDRDFVFEAVKQSGHALQYASDELKNNKEFVLAVINENASSLFYASKTLKNDRDVVLAAVKQTGYALEYASKDVKNDREVVLAAVKESGRALKYASESLKSDRDVVLAAVKQNGYALDYASDALKNDPEIRAAAGK